MPDWFSDVAASGGAIVERIEQTTLYSTEYAGALCVSLSTLWIGHSATASGPFADTLPRKDLPHSPATDFSRTRMHAVKSAMHAQVDTPLDVWSARPPAIANLLQWAAHVYPRKKDLLPSYVPSAVKTLVQTRSGSVMTWPSKLDAFTAELSSSAVANVVRDAEASFPTPLPNWRELAKYDFVKPFVAAWTQNRYPNVAHADFAGRPLPILDVIDGYRLLVIYQFTKQDDELTAFKGHMMALGDNAQGRTFYDPNGGIVRFGDRSRFKPWFDAYMQRRYGKAFADGGFVKTFWANR